MLEEIILSALFATPVGLAMVIGLLWLLREGFRWIRMRRLVKAAAEEAVEPLDADWEEVVYR